MNTITTPQMWQHLRNHGLVDGDMPESSGSASPWYVRVMLGVAGWIGALFLLGFVGAAFAFVMKSMAAAMILGVLCCAVAFSIFRIARENDFASQFGLALSLTGQGPMALL
jgi:hypothetical protein